MKLLFILVISLIILVGCQAKEGLSDETIQKWESEHQVEEKGFEEKEQEVDEEKLFETVKVDHESTEEEMLAIEKYQIDPVSWRVKPLEESDDKIILLTIDDAPDQFSVQMAEKLKELDAGAIFFVNGHFLKTEEDQQKLRMIYDLGFEIGNHTMNHPNMSQISEEKQRKEIIELNDLIENIIGERPRFYRAPFGINTEESKVFVEQEGMVSMNWTYGYDWEKEYQDAEALSEIMIHTPLLTNGANLLLHDRKWTKEALESIVSGLREKGYEPIDPVEIKVN